MKKTPGDIIILHKCTKNHDHMLYCSWDMACDRCNCYFSFWAISCPKKSKSLKNEEKNTWRHHHFTYVYKKLWSDVWFLRYGVQRMDRQMDGQTDRQKKWHIEVGVPPKKLSNPFKTKFLWLFHLNICSLRKIFDNFHILLNELNINVDITAITEWH